MTDFQKKWLAVNSRIYGGIYVFYLLVHIVFKYSLLIIASLYFVLKDMPLDWILFYFGSIFIFVFVAGISYYVEILACCLQTSDLINRRNINIFRKVIYDYKHLIASAVVYRTNNLDKIIYCGEFAFLVYINYKYFESWQILLGSSLICIGFALFSLVSFVTSSICKMYVKDYVNPVCVALTEGACYDTHPPRLNQ